MKTSGTTSVLTDVHISERCIFAETRNIKREREREKERESVCVRSNRERHAKIRKGQYFVSFCLLIFIPVFAPPPINKASRMRKTVNEKLKCRPGSTHAGRHPAVVGLLGR
ncbi:MAG TPA: hypothetical protein V6C97_00440 [Oculatellaceae cyanobacterium]